MVWDMILHRVYRVPGFRSIRPNWLLRPLTHKQVLSPPPPLWFQGGGDTLSRGRGGGGSLFGRRDRSSGTLGIVWSLYFPLLMAVMYWICKMTHVHCTCMQIYQYDWTAHWTKIQEILFRINGMEYLRPTGATVVVVVWFVPTETIATELWGLQNC